MGMGDLRPLHVVDINGDGLDDFFAFRDAGTSLQLVPHIALAGGTFQALNPLPGSFFNPQHAVFEDMDADGDIDVVAVRSLSVTPQLVVEVLVFLNNGGASSWTPVVLEISTFSGFIPVGIAVGDFNADSLKDIAYLTYSAGVPYELRCLMATGNFTYTNVSGGFAVTTNSPCLPCLPTTGQTYNVPWLRAVDIDQDGADDLVAVGLVGGTTALQDINRIWIWPGKPGNAPGPVEWSDPPGLARVSVLVEGPVFADFDLDGHYEVAVTPAYQYYHQIPPSNIPRNPDVMRLSPAGAEGARTRYDVDMLTGSLDIVPTLHSVYVTGLPNPGGVSGQLTAGDVDNDGDLDIVEVWCNCSTLIPALYTASPFVAAHLNQAIRRNACTGQASGLALLRGTPALGNQSYGIGLLGAPPGASAVLLLSRGEATTSSGSCSLLVDFSPNVRILPVGSLGFVTADSSGYAFVPIPIPGDPSLLWLTAYAQWIALDPLVGFSIGGLNYSLSDSALIQIW
jgi:hypothetical protein